MASAQDQPAAGESLGITRRFPVARLQRHSAYGRLFGTPPRAVVSRLSGALAADPAKRTPVEVLPDGSVVAAHEWVSAAQEAGLAELVVSELPDLARASEAVVEAYVIDAALRRGHHGRMARLRCLARAPELFADLPPDWRQDYHAGDIVGHAMRLFGKDRRTIQHYTPLLSTPRPIQDALDNEELDLKTVKAVAKLPATVQAEIARAIREGGKPREVVCRHVRPPSRRHKSAIHARDAAVRSMERVLADLGDRPGQVTWVTSRQRQVLVQTQDLIGDILATAAVAPERKRRANPPGQRSRREGEQAPPPPNPPGAGATPASSG